MIKASEYAQRRKALMQKLDSNSLLVIPSANEVTRNNDAFYPFRQNSDFYYLTGFNEPESVLVLSPKHKDGEYILFNRVRDREREIWDGPRAGQEGACKTYLADLSFPIEQFEAMLPELLAGKKTVYYPVGINKKFDHQLMQAVATLRGKIRTGLDSPIAFIDTAELLHEMRLIKSPDEIKTMQKAVDISYAGHLAAMQACKPGMHEYELEAALLYQFKKNGARDPAYNSIVGAGRNSCILHYSTNNTKIEHDDIVLIDAGAEYENYASDITRAFPANGKFNPEQRAIYELVLASQLAAIDAIKPGASWMAAQVAIVEVITQGLVDLGLLKGEVGELIETNAYFPFYMHRSGHWLGLDVHDVGKYQEHNKWRSLQPGMVLTIEPGIYISSDIPHVDKRWHNIGVRIEDDIVVTDKGHKVLSQQIPKTVSDIESAMAK